MTWVYKHTRSPGSRISAEYECPVHWRFVVVAERDDNGNPPAEMPCPEIVSVSPGASIDMADALSPWPIGMASVCGCDSPHVISAPGRVRVQRVTAARRGKDPERPPGCMDWQALAYDEKPPEEVMAAERKKDKDALRKMLRDELRK